MTARRELEEIADETGGAVGYRCWLGDDRFEPVLVLLLRYFDEAFLDLSSATSGSGCVNQNSITQSSMLWNVAGEQPGVTDASALLRGASGRA
jgi:hypothetical protein